MSDFIEIKRLKIPAYIGVYEWEKKIKQELVLDLRLYFVDGAVQKAAQQDQLKDALDYTAVTELICKYVGAHPVQLIETLAENLAQLLLRQFSICAVQLSIEKLAALAQAESVGITITRKK